MMDNLLWIILVMLLVSVLFFVYDYINSMKKIKSNIIKQYGKPIDLNKKRINFKNVKSYYNKMTKSSVFTIDDITWDDLNMNELFMAIDNTQSSIGEEALYNILREPLFDKESLKKRDNLIEYFIENDQIRFNVQFFLAKLGKNVDACISNYLLDSKGLPSHKLCYYRILSVLPIIALFFSLLNHFLLYLLIASILLNFLIHKIIKRKYTYKFEDYGYISSMVNCGYKISKLNIPPVNSNFADMDSSLEKVKTIKNKYVNMDNPVAMSDAVMLSEFFKKILLIEVIKFEQINLIINNSAQELSYIYDCIGTIDSMIAIASFRKTLEYYSKPNLVTILNMEDRHISFKKLYHPLLKQSVSNSCDIVSPILITGSNASGKSTFLKVIAINSLMAQTIYTTFSSEYESCFVRLYTSMALKDNIINKESYFMVEIKSLKRIIDGLQPNTPCLCLIDEILRGTNTIERISASSELLNYLAANNCICIGATHDVELTYILDKSYKNYHFQENINGNSINFDYKLYEGKSHTRNAIKLLGFMGYSQEIIDNAEARAEKFLRTNNWDIM